MGTIISIITAAFVLLLNAGWFLCAQIAFFFVKVFVFIKDRFKGKKWQK